MPIENNQIVLSNAKQYYLQFKMAQIEKISNRCKQLEEDVKKSNDPNLLASYKRLEEDYSTLKLDHDFLMISLKNLEGENKHLLDENQILRGAC